MAFAGAVGENVDGEEENNLFEGVGVNGESDDRLKVKHFSGVCWDGSMSISEGVGIHFLGVCSDGSTSTFAGNSEINSTANLQIL